MNIVPIRDLSDIKNIEARPYADFMPHESVYSALQDVATRHPERLAITFIEDATDHSLSHSWTHRQLNEQITRAANLFTKLAGNDEPRVAMLLPAMPEAYFTLFGGETAGVVCPINYLLGAPHIAELMLAAKINILVALGPRAELDIASKIPEIKALCPLVKVVLWVRDGQANNGPVTNQDLTFDEQLALHPSDRLLKPREIRAGDIAALFHTGGTTGKPKLAQHTHGNQLHAAWSAANLYANTLEDVMMNGFPLFHVAGSFVFGLSTLLAGGEVVLPTLLGMRNKAFVDRYWSLVALHRVTLLAAVPTVMTTLLGLSALPDQLRGVRALLTGGSPLPEEVAAGLERRFTIPVRNILGMTESAGLISVEPVLSTRVAGSCGLALPFSQVKATEDGVLCVRGPNVGPGYTDVSRNEGTFTADGWLITGDIGYVDSAGRIFITGRQKDLIIRSSHNIDPRVIEDALQQHPDVVMAAAVGEPDEYAGEIPIAYVTLKPGATITGQDLREFSERTIPERPAYPKRVEIVAALPLTAIGKVYKPALKAKAIEWVINERLERIHLSASVVATVPDEGAVPCVVFNAVCSVGSGEGDASVFANELRTLMAGFAIAYRIAVSNQKI
jgi:fatty-acyl-CoA synthase